MGLDLVILRAIFLLRKIALPYPHKCLLGFVEAKRGDQQEYLKIILVQEVNPVVIDRCACAQHIVGWTFSERSSFNFWSSWRLCVFLWKVIMAESQLKSTKRASGCGHPLYNWDTHLFCYPCRDKGKGQDVCVTSKEEDCFN